MATNTPNNSAAVSMIGVETGTGSGDAVRARGPAEVIILVDGNEQRYCLNNSASAIASGTTVGLTAPTGASTTLTVNGSSIVFPAPGVNLVISGTGWTSKTLIPAYGWGYIQKATAPL